MHFHADLHIHSKHSRATSKDCDLEHLAFWARKKGIAVVATGDFTHPVWLAELKQKLVPAEPGLFRLRDDIERHVADQLPPACHGSTRFMLSVEISTIYKKDDATRKIHHLIYVPDFAAADRVVARLARIGNIAADGRPILGLDSRHLLEIALEASPDAFLVPAHIWTPWFAVLGSRSGFDSIAACYCDLSDHIFAVETGLSSDPAMNWRVSFLDRYRLVSNSDAHSPAKLGREATAFNTDLDYFSLRRALATGHGYVGTVEFFPEEGKYHLDGHRKCGIRLTPEETEAHGGRCPVCGQPVTIGVMHRVNALADRVEADTTPPATAGAVTSLVPLPEIIAEISGTGPSSQAVQRSYERLIASLGAELPILGDVPIEDIARAESSLLAEAISRLRAGRVIRDAGYDGEYGVIRLFEEAELKRHTAGGLLFDLPAAAVGDQRLELLPAGGRETPALDVPPNVTRLPTAPLRAPEPAAASASATLAALDDDQRAAAANVTGPLMIVAGPGSGKTRTLTHRIAHIIADRSVPAAACLAITFTRRAAHEMADRLAVLLPQNANEIPIHTFHSLGLSILKEHANAAGLHRGFRLADEGERLAILMDGLDLTERKARGLLAGISRAKRAQRQAEGEIADALAAYQQALSVRNWIDVDDLVGLALQALTADEGLAALYRDRLPHISVDEFQDLDEQQYRLLKALAPPDANLCVIGDPNQAIYGFRGADAACFDRFTADYPGAAIVRLARNYRSSGTIVAASAQVIAPQSVAPSIAEFIRDMQARVTIHTAASDRAEAEFAVHTIERMLGGHSFFSIDSGRTTEAAPCNLSFADFAVLYRTDAQSLALCEAFTRSGMPYKKHSHEPLGDHPVIRALLKEMEILDDDAKPLKLRDRLRAAADRLARADAAVDRSSLEAAVQQLTVLGDIWGEDDRRLANAVSLATEADTWDPRADRISLLTLHAAKGLEFPVVFIVGLEDGILPLRWGPNDAADDEERRLLYVGMTRAKDCLFLSHAAKRHWRGKLRMSSPSPFLGDIEKELLAHSRTAARQPNDGRGQLALF
ncbi:MAG: UvrD-helicase domain-containing protein [Proteobacteria bacterium]|nr:UvrD-helicase domain-containing protein [Pseudomonadota bacterium]